MTEQRSTVAILGLGYVGCVSAACLARLGHQVIGVDRDQFKVQSVLQGRAPFFEPGLEDLIRDGVASGRLQATTSASEAIRDADVALVCVGTPSQPNGNLGLDQMERILREIGAELVGRTKRLIVAIRSTVFPGTTEEVVIPALGGLSPLVSVVTNPEFLREGAAVKDFMEPSLIVVGGTDEESVKYVAGLYRGLNTEPCLVSMRTAEMIKYACNAFHAVKVAFANEVGALSERLGVDGAEVMATLCRDTVLNVSPAYLKPGFAFGGSCLPKDLRALAYRASRLDMQLPLLENTLPSNQEHLRRAIGKVMALPGKLGMIGLAFKEDTDDVRESPVIAILEHLIGKGRDLRVFDPNISMQSIYGSNKSFVLASIPHIGRLMDAKLEQTLDWADQLILAQKQPAWAMELILKSGKPVTSLVG